MPYPPELKERVLRILAEPEHPSQLELSRRFGISNSTISRWESALRTSSAPQHHHEQSMAPNRPFKDKVRLVNALENSPPDEFGALLRQEGLHLHEVESWRELFSNAQQAPSPQELQAAKVQYSELEKQHKDTLKELQRKEKALAEAAALLILSKKVGQLWEEEDAPTPGQNVNASSLLFKKR